MAAAIEPQGNILLVATPSMDMRAQPEDDGNAREQLSEVAEAGTGMIGQPSNFRISMTIIQPSMINFLASFTNGVITVGLPTIAKSINLPRSLYLWPASVYGLTSGSILLLAGSIADLLGAKKIELAGCVLLGVFTLACGFSNTGIELVVFRAMQGIAMAMHLPSSVSIVANTVPSGRPRNIGFACLGLSQPLGFSVGLVASGILIETIGWRSGFYLAGGGLLMVAIVAFKGLPNVPPSRNQSDARPIGIRIIQDVDWVGSMISSGGLAILSYVLAILSADLASIQSPTVATLLPLSVVLLLGFPLWMNYRQRQGKIALVPNHFWKNLPFTSICLMAILSYGVVNSMELFSSLYFQEIQNTGTLFTSLKLLPSLVVGTILNLCVGLFVDRFPARWLVSVSSVLCAGAPLLMATTNPMWSYWYMAFWAQVLAPLSVDVLFTIGLIVVSNIFPEKSQGLAGAVFSTVSQFGFSLGVGVCQFIALGVAGGSGSGMHGPDDEVNPGDENPAATLRGYQASFWTMFALMIICAAIAVIGLRKAGTVGVKRE